MLVCPLCNAQYEPGTRRCPADGRRPLEASVIEAAQGDPLLGTTIADRYVIVGRVGSGGMGTVYRAEQQGMGREVALKVLRRDLGRDPDTAARFHREARALSQLKHPNTVTVFDFGQTSDRLLFLAMELLEGEMLSTRLKREGPLDVLFAIRVAMGVLRSLDEAHARGIVHRDLKPDNIFLAKVHGVSDADSEVVKVVDFGIAKIRDGERGIDALQTQEGTVFGTPRYMSPEQAQGKPLDGRSDLYAVGVLLFHMLTGRPPFTDDDAVIVMAHHIKTVPPPVRQVAPNRPIPASLERLVQRALSKDPAKRPQTAAEFLYLLEEVSADARALVDGRSTALTGANRASARMRFATYGIASIGAVALLVGLWPMRSPQHAANTTAQTRSLTPMQPRELATINATRFERVTHAAAAVPAQASQRSDSTSTSLTLTEPAPESARAEPTNTATKQSQSTSTSRAVRRSTVRGSSPSMQTVTFTRRTHAHVGIVQRWTD